MVDSY